jgi:predicted enzyme related to lactoylglutathione lyase
LRQATRLKFASFSTQDFRARWIDDIMALNGPPFAEVSCMAQTTTARRISPMLAVADMDEAIAFYQTVLGFTVMLKAPEYSIIERDGQTIHFQLAASDEVMKCVRDHTEIYIEVSGIQALWQHVKTFKDRYRIRDLFDREYGMTEFHISDPNSCLVFVAEPTAQANLKPRSAQPVSTAVPSAS